MGADDEERGDLDGALKKFLEASRTTAALLAAAPNDPERIYDQAQSEYWVAFISWRRQRLVTAREGFERYATLAGRLLAIDPENPDWQMEAGYAASNLGMLELRDANNATKAEAHFTIALQHFQSALHAKPGDTDIISDIADGYAGSPTASLRWGAMTKPAQIAFTRDNCSNRCSPRIRRTRNSRSIYLETRSASQELI